MTQTVTIEDAKRDISRLLDRVKQQADEIVISENGHPIARIIPSDHQQPQVLSPRVPGSCKGKVFMADDFDDPLPKEIEDLFYQ